MNDPGPRSATPSPLLHWILRLGCVWCFIGHGAFGIRMKEAWIPYFQALGFSEPTTLRLMPIVGTVDIVAGILVLLSPFRAVLLHMALWGLFTATLRPLAGESWWEVLERAGNYGVPLAFLAMSGWGRSWREWFEPITPRPSTAPDVQRMDRVAWILRWTTALLLIGHGGFGAFMHKTMLAQHYASAGLDGIPLGLGTLVQAVGWVELFLGAAVLMAPIPPLLLFVFAWKIATELLYPISGSPVWEFVERGGSYAAPLGLFWLQTRRAPAAEPALERPGVRAHEGVA